jgi:hypothetical protein
VRGWCSADGGYAELAMLEAGSAGEPAAACRASVTDPRGGLVQALAVTGSLKGQPVAGSWRSVSGCRRWR